MVGSRRWTVARARDWVRRPEPVKIGLGSAPRVSDPSALVQRYSARVSERPRSSGPLDRT